MSASGTPRDEAFLGFMRVLGGAISAASIVFGLLVVQPIIDQSRYLASWWTLPAVLLVFGIPVALGPVARWGSLRMIRLFAGAGALGYLLTMITWVPVQLEPFASGAESPWINSVTAIGAASAATAFRRSGLVWGYLVVASALVGVTRFAAAEDRTVSLLVLDSLFSVMFCSVFTGLALVSQRAAHLVDKAARSAGAEVIQSATTQARDRERSRFEALMHDGILSTLLIASDDRPEMRSAVARQAGATLDRLEMLSADTVDEEVLSVTDFLRVQQSVVTEVDPVAHFTVDSSSSRFVPGDVSAAISEALTEALRNSVRHAGYDDESRTVSRAVHARMTDELVEVVIVDDGRGFDTAIVPPNRMGVAVSILTRMQRLAGGAAEVTSEKGRGTAVVLSWRRP